MCLAMSASSFVTNAELVVDEDALQLGEPSRAFVEPSGRALEPARGANVEHQESVDVAEQVSLIEIAREEHRVLRLHAAVAADEEVPPLLAGDDAEVFALRFGAFARAARDGRLELVRCAKPPVAKLDLDRQSDAVLNAVAAPGAADARLHGAQGLGIGVPRLEAGFDQAEPDFGELLDARPEEVDSLSARDLGVKAVVARDGTERDELVGRDLTPGDARHDRVGAVFLQVGEEVVVGVLQRRLLPVENVAVVVSDASIEATAGLQISQTATFAERAKSSPNDETELTRTMSNSS